MRATTVARPVVLISLAAVIAAGFSGGLVGTVRTAGQAGSPEAAWWAGQAAWADETTDLVEEAADCLATQRICYMTNPSDNPYVDEDLAAALPGHLTLVVVAPAATGTFSATQLAGQIASQSLERVLLMTDSPSGAYRFGLAGSDLSQNQIDEVLTALNQTGAANGYEAIVGSTDVLAAALDASDVAPQPDDSVETGGALDTAKRVLAIIGLSVLGLIIAIAVIIVLILRHSSPRRVPASRVDKKLFDNSEHADSIERSLLKLKELVGLYGGDRAKYTVRGQPVFVPINTVIADVQELFRRLRASGSAQQTRLAQVKYADLLRKLILTVGPEYYKDIVDNPRLWTSPQERLDAIGGALNAVHDQILENIKQVNASKDLEFKVALDSLLESERAAKLSDAYVQDEADGLPRP
ncbi:MAG: hypothetical protein LBJ62_03010 [Bifidobacteriaceae bacterium]|jgi:hypothetical protein|nr:hypothetical protein [Bifidobacteriaceae bacterium]